MDKKAKIYTYTVIHSASEAFKDKTPYVVAVVDDGQEKFLTRVEGYDDKREIHIGMEVELLVTDENGSSIYQFI